MAPGGRGQASGQLKRRSEALQQADGAGTGLPSAICNAECNSSKRLAVQRLTSTHFLSTLPSVWREREFTCPDFDKGFACEWQDADSVVVGTKCNNLLHLNVSSGRVKCIPRPEAPQDRSFVVDNPGWGKCGIHCMASNPARDLLATGGTEPADCVILRTADWRPVAQLVGHRDWLFGVAWVTDRHVVTGSRDSSIALWNVDADACGEPSCGFDQGVPVQRYNYHNKAHMKRKFDGKVRELKYNPTLDLVAALSTEGVVKLHDAGNDLRVIRTLSVGSMRELVAMAVGPDLIAVGGLSATVLVDARQRGSRAAATVGTSTLLSPDANHGVRSLCIKDRVLSFGTGRGKLCFYDIRAGGCVPTVMPSEPVPASRGTRPEDCDDPPLAGGPYGGEGEAEGASGMRSVSFTQKDHLALGHGWVDQNDTYHEFFAGVEVRHACYAHAWDPTGSRLFACGGPLAFGLRGGYMAVWE